MIKDILVIAGWLSLLAMMWFFFTGIAPASMKNIVIFVLLFILTVFATAVDDKPKTKNESRFGKN